METAGLPTDWKFISLYTGKYGRETHPLASVPMYHTKSYDI